MKLTIDVENKIVEVDGVLGLKTIVDTLKELFPNGGWKEFAIRAKTEYVPTYVPYDNSGVKPWWETQPTVLISDNSGEFLYKG